LTTAILSKELYHAINKRNAKNAKNNQTLLTGKSSDSNDSDRIQWLRDSNEIENKYNDYYLDSNDVSTFNALLRLYNNTYHTNGNSVPFNFTSNGLDTVTPQGEITMKKSPVGNHYILYKDGKMVKADTAKAMIQDTSRYHHKHMANAGARPKGSFSDDYLNDENRKKRADDYKNKVKASKMLKHSYFDTLERSKSEPMYDELYHHGIFGMKWGIRRYQNEDGTLTPEGRKRYLLNYVDVDEKGNTKLAAVGDADKRRRDLEKQGKKDARAELMKNPAFRMGAILGSGGAATSASLGLIGGLGLANPAVAAAGVAGSGILGGLGFGVGSHIGKKQTGLDEPDVWGAKNLKKYDVNTSNLGYDVKWLKTSELAKFKNDLNRRNLVDSIYNNNATVKIPKKK